MRKFISEIALQFLLRELSVIQMKSRLAICGLYWVAIPYSTGNTNGR